jgi:leader peptidase (prepilin peptidase)/N-methyltransferase
LFVFQAEGLSIRYLIYLYFLLCLTAIAFIDLERMIIPDILVLPTALLGLILAVVSPNPAIVGEGLGLRLLEAGWSPRLISFLGSLVGMALGFGSLFLVATLYKAFRGKTGLGDGDPLLLGLIGIYLGWLAIFPILFISTTVALFSVGVLLLKGLFPAGPIGARPIPFGPFLALAALIWYFYGATIFRWYQGLYV